MKQNVKKKIVKVLPYAGLLMFIVLIAVLAFIPTRRDRAVSATSYVRDAEAVRVLENCAAYTRSHDFSTTVSGVIKARVFGVPYTQKATGGRTVRGDDFTEVAESVSSFVKMGVKKTGEGGKYYVCRADYKKKRFIYDGSVDYSRGEFIDAYGKPPVGLVKYELDGAITSAEKIGECTYRYTLDPSRAARYSRNEVRTTLESKTYPEYEAIVFELTVDNEGRPVTVKTIERFRVDKFGGTDCTTEFVENFSF